MLGVVVSSKRSILTRSIRAPAAVAVTILLLSANAAASENSQCKATLVRPLKSTKNEIKITKGWNVVLRCSCKESTSQIPNYRWHQLESGNWTPVGTQQDLMKYISHSVTFACDGGHNTKMSKNITLIATDPNSTVVTPTTSTSAPSTSTSSVPSTPSSVSSTSTSTFVTRIETEASIHTGVSCQNAKEEPQSRLTVILLSALGVVLLLLVVMILLVIVILRRHHA
ncbi:uncharacterized protein LOC134177414 [Corticium candelabrum]|uniref:uncharacterized protein LOC134177414 n=1 Tax=Corticium candelabrum TaxID=121492 RepID=UPI002E263280|nr:uncharacterized protein LOC134177414 [Corticium candelabrum]